MTLQVLDMDFSILSLRTIPENISAPFTFFTITDKEISLLIPSDKTPSQYEKKDDGWKGFRIEGVLDFSLIGILSEISGILAQNKIGIFACSTYDTDYIFVKDFNLEKALLALSSSGYNIIR